MSTVFVGDVGTVIKLDTGTDLTSATALKIKVKKPNGTEVEWTASQDANNPKVMTYTIQSGDLDQSGTWKLQAYVEFPTWQGRGEWAKLKVSG